MTATYEAYSATIARRNRLFAQCDLANLALTELERYAARILDALTLVSPEQRGALATMLADEMLRLHTAAQQALLAVASAAAEVDRDAG